MQDVSRFVNCRAPSRREQICASLALTLVLLGLLADVASARRESSASSYHAVLSAEDEIPHPSGVSVGARGTFAATLMGRRFSWTLTYTGLTGRVGAAYLHYGDRHQTGTVLTAVCTECISPAHGSLTLTPAELKDLQAGDVYINLDTARNPRGEIRGQVT